LGIGVLLDLRDSGRQDLFDVGIQIQVHDEAEACSGADRNVDAVLCVDDIVQPQYHERRQ
jgi:hypothetical protein